MSKLGVYFGMEKQGALFRGDTSNTVVNRYFLYGFQAIGTHLSEVLDESPVVVRLLARYAQRAWETLIEIYKTGDQILKAKGLLLYLHALVVKGYTSGAQLYIAKMCELIDEGNLQFLPVYGRPPELSDQVREDAAVLSQTIYLENYLYLALDGPTPVKTAKIEREFRQDFQVRFIRCGAWDCELNDLAQRAYPPLLDICPLTMRTQGILLVRDATLVLDPHSTDRKVDLNVSIGVVTDSYYL